MFTTSAALDGFRTLSSAEFAPWLMDTAVKASVLLLITSIAAWLLRRRSAALVHRVWTLGFCGCLVIPFATYFAPLGTLPILPNLSQNDPFGIAPATFNGPATVPFTAAVSSSTAADAQQLPNIPLNLSQAHEPTPPASTTSPSGQPAAAVLALSLPARATSAERISWPRLLLGVWLAGIAICLLRAGWQMWRLTRVLGRAAAVESDLWTAAVADAAQSLGLGRRINIAMIPGARIPAVTGIWRPLLLLPTDAESWSPERRRLVLLHELAHAQRRDVLAHTIAQLVCAAHWFNPLCWFGLIQMGRLRELACDDLVLASGQTPVDYADVLLDVARTYRHRSLGMSVGMARRANVEDRILAILDRARNRMSLSPRAARRWAVGTIAVVALLGSLRLSTSAEPPNDSPPKKNEPSKSAPAENDKRTIQLRITDEAGVPLAGASLMYSAWVLEGEKSTTPNARLRANTDGIVEFTLPRHIKNLRLWPASYGYVPEYIEFKDETHDDGRLIPDKYEFRLANGTVLSGAVVDEHGQPISGVTVDVRVEVREPAGSTKPDPMISTWLTDDDFTEGPVVTNTDGKWSINNAPAPTDGDPFVFRLKHRHPNYIRDTQWGQLQDRQGVTTAMLRDGTARIVLKRGVPVKGTVVDSSGQPVTKGLVIWNDRPYWADGVNETTIGSDGRFETQPLSPGEYPITVIAPGFAPIQRKLAVTEGLEDLQFKLSPGNRLVMKVVDSSGNPVPNAYVGIADWRGTEAIYNVKHPNVPESGIPDHADEQGIYVWDWAPDDAVTYGVSAKDFAHNDVSLVGNGKEHVVELSRPLVARGRVTDARTGAPIKEFRIIPVIEFRPQFLSTAHSQAVPGKDGTFEAPLAGYPQSNYRYRIRVEAHGYRSVLSEQSYAVNAGAVTADFELEPAPARIGRVIDSQGQPVEGALIVEGTPSDVPMTTNGELDHGTDLKSGPDGSFEFPATFEPARIRAIHLTGIAETLRLPDEEVGTLLRLQPWAKVSGRLLQDGQPMAEQLMIFSPSPDRGLGEARFQDTYQVRTDKNGRFEFTRLPPGIGSIRTYLGPWQESPLTSSESVVLNLQPGEHMELVLGGNDITVTGQVNATGRGDVELNKNWSLNHLIRRDAPPNLPADFPPLGFDPSGPVQSAWFLDPHIHGWLATRPNYFVKLSPDGQFRIHGVPPGQYDLVLQLYEQPAGCLVETIGEKVVPIEVTAADATAGTKDVGAIDVACRAGPRAGQNMQAYKIVDATGRERSIFDLQGGYVVLHVWASWCAPCLAHMPEIQAAVAEWKGRWKEQPMTVVGLNIDADKGQAQALVGQQHWDWAQMYLGDDSDMSRQLAISTVPTYYLIGPDGKLVTSASEWSQIRQALETAGSASP